MAKYSNTERRVAGLLNAFPGVKQFVKQAYQQLNYYLHKKSYTIKTEFNITKFSDGERESFFGYYDKLPINITASYIIYQSSSRNTKNKPSAKHPIDIVLAEFPTGKVLEQYSSNAYNWQQGCKLMWISESEFIFNDFDKNKQAYISKIVNAETLKITHVLDQPVYDFARGKIFSLNFCRLNELRPDYGYRNITECTKFDYKNDGIFLTDIQSNTTELFLSLENIIQFDYKKNMDDAEHYVNHIMISPSGKKMIFLHRYFVSGRRYDRLFISSIENGDLRLLSDHEMISHCYWIDDIQLVAYMRRHDYGDKFYRINTDTGLIEPLSEKTDGTGDGHPHIVAGKMLYDSYPDKSRLKSLFLFDFSTEEKKLLAEFYESLKFKGETRCDLHPRMSLDGKYAFVDSVHSGKRQLYCISLKESGK